MWVGLMVVRIQIEFIDSPWSQAFGNDELVSKWIPCNCIDAYSWCSCRNDIVRLQGIPSYLNIKKK